MCKILMLIQSLVMIGLTNEHFMISTNQKVCLKASRPHEVNEGHRLQVMLDIAICIVVMYINS